MNSPKPGSHYLLALPFVILSVFILLNVDSRAQSRKNKKAISVVRPSGLILADGNSTLYRILLPSFPTIEEQKAADVLQKYVLEISGAALPIIPASAKATGHEIVIGQNERCDQVKLKVDWNNLKEDGFLITTDSSRLFIAGGSGKGALNGVYAFLEEYLGCRMYTPQVKVVPHRDKIIIPEIKGNLQIPKILFRDTHYRATWDAAYIDWHKLDQAPDGERPDWGSWVHTFNDLLPPDLFYKDHPEYFAMVNGKRIPTQLCLSNAEVLSIVIQNLRRKIAANPKARYWSVSQNDNHDYCTCNLCKAVDDKEGSPSGSIIQFVNKVADQFPDKMISTLAYEYGRHAPFHIQPRSNVNIMLCSIEALRHQPIEEDPKSAVFVKDLQDWGAIAKDIIIWDYVIQFNHLVSPFPNLHVLQPNLQTFVKYGVTAMFEQGNSEVGGEFSELRSYLLAKLMWNQDLNVDSLMNDFLNGYYGAAGPFIRKYIDQMRNALLQSGQPLRIFGTPNEATNSYLKPEQFAGYQQFFKDAESAVKDRPEILERVRIARLPLAYATMEQAKKNYIGDHGVFEKVNREWKIRTSIRSMIDPFTDLCIRQGITRLKEWSCPPEEYRSAMYRVFSQGMNEHLGFGKPVTFISPDATALPPDASKMLTDGIRGSHDYDYNWLSFNGKDLEAVVDLQEIKSIHRIESAYYQYGFWLRLLPGKVEYSVSMDGKTYSLAGTVHNTLPIDQYGGIQRDFISEFTPQNARYVKVKAYTIGNTPGWHPGAGRPANILIDEIVIE
ncbi:MAG: DUF4838 domain-containing protein [Chryseolinea sp.]